MHGDINEPDKCIFFPSQYEELYNSGEQAPIFELKKIISDKSILFLGFSLSDPYINYVISFINQIYYGLTQEHFIITTSQPIQNSQIRLTPILINSYEELDDCLIQIKNKISPNQNDESQKKINTNQIDENININININIEFPPSSKFWVGRKKEIQNLSIDLFKVIFITGIGGQGKSALASYILKDSKQKELYEFVDWRDFKEETNRFQTKLISILQRLTNNTFPQHSIESSSTNDLIDLVFKHLYDRKILFVFDNIDSHIDLQDFVPTGSMKYFFEQAQNTPHKSKFIFTCRPFIREAGSEFYQIKLDGLSEDECLEIFQLYEVSVSNTELIELSNRSYQLTKGHPLWINLIAAQASRGIKTVNQFIKSIEDKTKFNEEGFSAIISEKILNEVWSSLNEKQKNLLHVIAESVKPESMNTLKDIIKSELNHNQFTKAFRVLKNLNLIEIKLSDNNEDLVELHPLVKEFIISKFPTNERTRFITLLVQYYDGFIYILKSRLNKDMKFTDFQNWMSKIELHINDEDYISALLSLKEVSSPLLSAGYTEEFIRVSEKLFSSIKFREAIDNEYPYFHSLFIRFTTVLPQFGSFTTNEALLEKYSNAIPGKSNHFLSYCSAKCYNYWLKNEYQKAIEIGEHGAHLLNESGISDRFLIRHNLALAYRDSNNAINIEKALNIFLKTETIQNILDNINVELGGSFYGNIGRCLELLNDTENALTCYYISLHILTTECNSVSLINIGYAASWIYQLLKNMEEYDDALYFYKMAFDHWEKTAPPLAIKLKNIINNDPMTNNQKLLDVEKLSEWQINNLCKEIAKTKMASGFTNK